MYLLAVLAGLALLALLALLTALALLARLTFLTSSGGHLILVPAIFYRGLSRTLCNKTAKSSACCSRPVFP